MEGYENSKIFDTTSRLPPVCGHCRRLKVRCQRNPGDKSGKCQRCTKAGRSCVFQVERMIQQDSQHDSQIIRLEEKIDALTSAWNIANCRVSNSSLYGQMPGSTWISDDGDDTVQSFSTSENGFSHRQKRVKSSNKTEILPSQVTEAQSQRSVLKINLAQPLPWSSHPGENFSGSSCDIGQASTCAIPLGLNPRNQSLSNHLDTDVVGQGILPFWTASLIFDHFVSHMAPQLPAVVFPIGSDVHYQQLTKPILFLAILSVGSSELYPDLHEQLNKITLQVLIDRVVGQGQKSLEIVQALIVYTTWYHSPLIVEQLTLQQLLAIAALMVDYMVRVDFAQRLGPTLGLLEQNSEDVDWTLQFRRAWPTDYIWKRTSMQWQGPSLIRWSFFGTDCVVALESPPKPLYSDLVLCQTACYQRVVDNITEQSAGDRVAELNSKDNHILLGSKDFAYESLEMYKEAANMYIREPVMHHRHEKTLFRAPYALSELHQIEPQRELETEEVESLYACIVSAQNWINWFLSLEVYAVRRLPSFYFADAVYAIIVLVAAAFTVADRYTLDGSVSFQIADLDSNVGRLENAFRNAAKDHKCLAASRLCPIFVKIREGIQHEIASQVTDVYKQRQSNQFADSNERGFEHMFGWPNLESSICTEFGGNLSLLLNTSELNQHNNALEYPSLRDDAFLSKNASGHLPHNTGMIGDSGQIVDWHNNAGEFVDKGTSDCSQAMSVIPLEFD